MLALLLVAACVSDEVVGEECTAEAPVALIGEGETQFEELEDGDTVMMVTGSQGGEHLYGSLRLWNTDSIVILRYSITRDDDDTLISDQTYRVAMVGDGDCRHVYVGMFGYLGFTSDYTVSLQGIPVTLRMDATDSAERTASDEVHVVVGTDSTDGE